MALKIDNIEKLKKYLLERSEYLQNIKNTKARFREALVFADEFNEALGIPTPSAVPYTLCKKFAPATEDFPKIQGLPNIAGHRLCEALNFHVYLTDIKTMVIAAIQVRGNDKRTIEGKSVLAFNANFGLYRLIYNFYHEPCHIILNHPTRIRAVNETGAGASREAGLFINKRRIRNSYYYDDEITATSFGVEFVLPKRMLENTLIENDYNVDQTIKDCKGLNEFMVVSKLEMNRLIRFKAFEWWSEHYKSKRLEKLNEFYTRRDRKGPDFVKTIVDESQYASDDFCKKRCPSFIEGGIAYY
jgi:hypothetical protein